jgi:phosphatidylserine decarboxylase
MKHAGKARQAALKLILWTLLLLVIVAVVAFLGKLIWPALIPNWSTLGVPWTVLLSPLVVSWVLFTLFTLYFFRDPEARVPEGPNLIVAPAHGTADVIDETTEAEVMGGPCRRISIFLSVFDVHVQNAPVAGTVTFFRHKPGRYLNAMRSECVADNENVLIGLEPKERPGAKLGVRLVAGVIARRIVPWVALGDAVARGQRLGLIQFGSRVELYLPLSARLRAKRGDKVVGGETIVATFD